MPVSADIMADCLKAKLPATNTPLSTERTKAAAARDIATKAIKEIKSTKPFCF